MNYKFQWYKSRSMKIGIIVMLAANTIFSVLLLSGNYYEFYCREQNNFELINQYSFENIIYP